jgi:hypothetical protein
MNDYEENIKTWLKKQGYPLEMRVAREFKRAGFMVEMATYYKDDEGNKFREIDIVASRVGWADKDRKIFFDIHYTCECKHSEDKPWVLFRSNSEAKSPDENEIACKHATTAGHMALLALSIDEVTKNNSLLRRGDRPGYGVTRALDGQSDIAYKAVMSAVKAASSLARQTDEEWNKESIRVIRIFFPLVVTTGRLFSCQLSEDPEISLDEITEGSFRFKNPEAGEQQSIIEIVTEAGLEVYLRRRAEWAAELLAHIEAGLPGLRKLFGQQRTSEEYG